jgi:phage terminase large subunit-like protein
VIDPLLAPADAFRDLPRRMREHYYAAAPPGALAAVHYDPAWWLRPDQRPPPPEDDYGILVFRGNRGTGKTEAAIYYFAGEIHAGRARDPAIVVGTGKNDPAALAKRFQRALAPRLRPRYEKSTGPAGTFYFPGPDGEVEVPVFSSAAPEALPMNNFDLAFADDIAKWGPHAEQTWNHLRACVRIGVARIVVATTARGTKLLLRRLLGGNMEGVVIRRPPVKDGRPDAWANRRNLNAKQLARAVADARGTRFGREEHDDEDTASNSPFDGLDFDSDDSTIRVKVVRREEFEEIIVAADPAEGKGGDHDEWGIGAAGRRPDGDVVGLEDGSGEMDDAEAGERVLALCERWGATKIVCEKNRGERVFTIIRAAWNARRAGGRQGKLAALPELIGVTARDQKRLRAGELRPLYLSGLLHHGPGMVPVERQAREWDPDAPRRPRVDDRIDWWVHAVHYLARLAERGDAWAPEPETPPTPAGPDAYRYQPVPPSAAPRDGWSAGDPFAGQAFGGDPLRY